MKGVTSASTTQPVLRRASAVDDDAANEPAAEVDGRDVATGNPHHDGNGLQIRID